MKIVVPVEENEGLESRVYGHFGSAPVFVTVDGETGLVTDLARRAEGAEGGCAPIQSIADQGVTAAIVHSIGGGALMNLTRAGVLVYRATEPTIEDNLHLLKRGVLDLWTPGATCGCSGHGDHGHGHDHGHSHGHGHHHHGGGCGCGHKH